jgi:hypothetical protein
VSGDLERVIDLIADGEVADKSNGEITRDDNRSGAHEFYLGVGMRIEREHQECEKRVK